MHILITAALELILESRKAVLGQNLGQHIIKHYPLTFKGKPTDASNNSGFPPMFELLPDQPWAREAFRLKASGSPGRFSETN